MKATGSKISGWLSKCSSCVTIFPCHISQFTAYSQAVDKWVSINKLALNYCMLIPAIITSINNSIKLIKFCYISTIVDSI